MYMDSGYCIDPRALQANAAYRSLSRSERGLLRDLMDYVWTTAGCDRIGDERAAIADALEATAEELDDLIEKAGSPRRSPLVKVAVELSSGSQLLVFPILTRAIEAEQEALARRRHARQRNADLASMALSRTACEPRLGTPDAVYLPAGERVLDEYRGWLPTSRFIASGQVFVVHDRLLTDLRAEFPRRDIESDLRRMWEWFEANPKARQTLAAMPAYIRRWLERAEGAADAREQSALAQRPELERRLLERYANLPAYKTAG
jgi:hypothetical protein